MSKKDDVICSANKQLLKLVNVYVLFFIEKKKKAEKEQTEKEFTILTNIRRATTKYLFRL